MTDFLRDMVSIRSSIEKAYSDTSILVSMAEGSQCNPSTLQMKLEDTLSSWEFAVLNLRVLCEKNCSGSGSYGKKRILSSCSVSGYLEVISTSQLHICINTLLPHCRYQTPAWLTDTLKRLMDDFENKGGQLPYFSSPALLVIDEHSSINGRHIFDQDNKGWKAISNTIKGRLLPDDDQYSLGMALLSTLSETNECHIYLIDKSNAASFFDSHLCQDNTSFYPLFR